MDARYNKAKFHRRSRILWNGLTESEALAPDSAFPNGPQRHYLRRLSGLTKRTIPPSYRLEHLLNPWVNFLIMPIFALANAGVEITDPSYFNVFSHDPSMGGAGMGIFLGLLVGKPLGITLASWIAIKCGVGEMPAKSTWAMLFAVACLGGIGFTMSIFVDTLSFAGPGIPAEVTAHLRDAGKIAVLLGSLCAGIFGSLLITLVHKAQARSIKKA
jgi:NhaA family Na+:H+ antiporter